MLNEDEQEMRMGRAASIHEHELKRIKSDDNDNVG